MSADGVVTPTTSRRLPLALLPLAVTYMAIAVNMSIASIALPSISMDMQASAADLTWIVIITPLASAALILFSGSWADRVGRKRVLQLGVGTFAITALLSAFAVSPLQLIVLRGLTGVGSSLAMPAALALAFDVVTPTHRRTAVGILTATQASGSLLGPIFGGLLLVNFGWGAAFAGIVPFLLVALFMQWLLLPRDRLGARQDSDPIDVVGALLVSVSAVLLLWSAVKAADPESSVAPLVAALTAAVLVMVLVWWERRCPHPIFVGDILRRPTFWLPTLTVMLTQFVLGGVMFTGTQYIQLVLGLSALAAGAFLGPAILGWILASSTAGLSARFLGSARVSAISLVIAAVGLLVVYGQGTVASYPMLILGLFLVGVMGAAPALMTHMAIDNYPMQRRAVGAAVNSMAMRFGLALGAAAFGSLLASTYAAHLHPMTTGLSREAAHLALGTIGGAVQIAHTLDPTGSVALIGAAKRAFDDGFDVALIGASAVLVVTAIAIWFIMGRHESAQAERDDAVAAASGGA